MSKKSAITQFLSKNSISPANFLPLVHSAESYILKKSLKDGVLRTSPCNIFKSEDLLYFFVGRPAYKKLALEEAEYWELPSCIVFDFQVSNAKRAFPFDSGAFSQKRYPKYISMMELGDFEFVPTENNVKRAIGAFFNNTKDYYRLNPLSEDKFTSRHSVDATEEEIIALHKLIKERSKRFDDRRFSLEMQFSESFKFSERRPIFAVFPETYISSEIFMDWIEKYDIYLETYPVYPLRQDYYYSVIYEKIDRFYEGMGFYEV